MLHVIGLILKIIGILLLAVLSLLLFLLLIVLLVPIRYRVEAEHGDDLLAVDGRVNFLLHLINARITYLEGVFHVRIRVLWFNLFDNLEPKKTKVPKKKKTVKKRPAKPVGTTSDKNRKESSRTKQTAENRIKENNKKDNSIKDNKINNKYSKDNSIKEKNVSESNITVDNIREDNIKKDNLSIDHIETDRIENIIIQDGTSTARIQKDIIFERKLNEGIRKDCSNQESNIHENNNHVDTDNSKSKLELLFEKLRSKIQGILAKIKGLKARWNDFWEGTKSRLQSILTSAANIRQKISLVLDFIRDEYNRQGFRITYSSVKKLLKHILPTKLISRIVFGTGDPCSTGQALGAMSILYSFYGDKIQIIPDFENKRLEGKHYARGRIRLVTILIIVIKLMLDKRFQQLRKNFQILKEAL